MAGTFAGCWLLLEGPSYTFEHLSGVSGFEGLQVCAEQADQIGGGRHGPYRVGCSLLERATLGEPRQRLYQVLPTPPRTDRLRRLAFASQLTQALDTARFRAFCMGIGVDPLTFATAISLCSRSTHRCTDELFDQAAGTNAEGSILPVVPPRMAPSCQARRTSRSTWSLTPNSGSRRVR